jgi:hypothetical protein
VGFNGVEARDAPSLSDHGWFDNGPVLEVIRSLDAIAHPGCGIESEFNGRENCRNCIWSTALTLWVETTVKLKQIVKSIQVTISEEGVGSEFHDFLGIGETIRIRIFHSILLAVSVGVGKNGAGLAELNFLEISQSVSVSICKQWVGSCCFLLGIAEAVVVAVLLQGGTGVPLFEEITITASGCPSVIPFTARPFISARYFRIIGIVGIVGLALGPVGEREGLPGHPAPCSFLYLIAGAYPDA